MSQSAVRSAVRSVKGLVTLVTGGASGLGRAAAQRLLNQGGKVVICDLPTSKGEDVAKELGENTVFVAGDVKSEDDVKNVLAVTEDRFKRLDAVVSCAGLACAFAIYNNNKKTYHHMADFEKINSNNVIGTFNVCRLSAGLMAKNEGDELGQRGVIITTSGLPAMEGEGGQTAISASMAGIVGMTIPMARDLASVGIRCCNIAPGLFDTPLLQALPEEIRSFLADTMPFPHRLGHPDEFAHLVQFIMENPMMNGETIRIDGALRQIC